MKLKPEHWRIVRFTVVGMTVTVTYFLLALLLSSVSNIETVSASAVAYVMSALLSFWGHRKITFKSDQAILGELVKFLLANGVGLFLATIIPAIISGYFAMSSLVSFTVVMGVVPAISFLMMRYFVFMQAR